MQAVMIIIGLALALFAVAFISKRRFGIIGLALSAGLVLSQVWSYEAILIASIFGFGSGESGPSMIKILVILLPSLILMLHGGKCKTSIGRFVGALAFTVLAVAFIIEPLGYILSLNGSMADAYMRFVNQKNLIIGAGTILAVIDVFMIKYGNKLPIKRR